MADNDDFGAFVAGIFIGGLVGAAVALLLAPQSGEETRTYIKDKSIELKDRAVEAGQEARGKAEKALEDARVRANQAIQDLEARSNEVAQMARQRLEELQQRESVLVGEEEEEMPAEEEPGTAAA